MPYNKNMDKRLIPSFIAPSVYEIDPVFFTSRGITTVLCDLDNTLDDYSTKKPGPQALELKKKYDEAGLTLYVASNNSSKRVRHYCEALGVDFTCSLYKPFKRRLIKWMKKKGLEAKKTAFVGDQILTDMLSANRAKLLTVLVNPFHPEKDSPLTWLNRRLEKPIRKKIYSQGLAPESWKKL